MEEVRKGQKGGVLEGKGGKEGNNEEGMELKEGGRKGGNIEKGERR